MSYIKRASVWQNTASLAVVDCSAIVNKIISRKACPSGHAALLGGAVACALYLCSWIEESERISIVFEDGAGGKLRAGGGGDLLIWGAADLNGAWNFQEGKGFVSVTRDGGRGLPMTGTCALASPDIAESMSAYFAESEQRPTAIGIAFSGDGGDNRCIALFVQPLTGADKSVLARAEQAVADCKNKTVDEILAYFSAESMETRHAAFGCTCSRGKAERAILSVGEAGARAVLEQEGAITVHCHDCNEDYLFTKEDIDALFRCKKGTI